MYDPASIFGAWLDTQEWDLWATFTLRSAVYSRQTYAGDPVAVAPTLKRCRAATERAFRDLGIHRAFWATERGFHGRWHVHALLEAQGGEAVSLVSTNGADHIRTQQAEAVDSYWRRKHGIASVEPYIQTRGAAGYCAKYVTKQLSDYDLWLTRSRIFPVA